MSKNIESIRFYKSFKIEEEFKENKEFIYLIPEVEIKYCVDRKYDCFSEVPIFIDESIIFEKGDIKIESCSKLSLLDVMTCVFDELSSLINTESLISPLSSI